MLKSVSAESLARFKANLTKEIGRETHTKDARYLMLETAFGCSRQCPFCLLNPKKLSGNFIPIEIAVAVAEAIKETSTPLDFYPYFRTDPLDHPQIQDIALAFRALGVNFRIVTSVPKNTADRFFELFNSAVGDLKLSFSFMNERELTKHPNFPDFGARFQLKKVIKSATTFILGPEELSELRCSTGLVSLTKFGLVESGELLDRLRRSFPQLFPLRPLLFSDSQGIYIGEERGGTGRPFTNLVQLSNAIVSGRLKPRQPFLFEHWDVENGSDFESTVYSTRDGGSVRRSIALRSWDIHTSIRVPGTLHRYFGILDSGSYGVPAILVLADGSILHVGRTADGLHFEQLHGPVC